MVSSQLLFIYGALALAVSVILTRIMIWVNVTDLPNARSSHSIATPRSGGIGIIGGFSLVILGAYLYGTFEGIPSKPLLIIFSGSLFMAFIGLMDDIKGLTWFTRIFAQLALALTVVWSGVTFKSITLPYFGSVDLGFYGHIIAVLWIIGFTNAFNFMDGINGISGGVAFIVSAILMFMIHADPLLLFGIGVLPFAVIGFLLFNFPHGKIFLGDVGSQFLGFLFACLGLLLPQIEPHTTSLMMPMLFFLYLFDTSFTISRRLKKRENVFTAHRDHLYQVLVRAGWSQVHVSCLYFLFFALQGGLALEMSRLPKVYHIYLFIPLLALYTLFTISVIKYAKKRGVEL